MVLITKYNFEKKTQKVRHGKNTKKKGYRNFYELNFHFAFKIIKKEQKKIITRKILDFRKIQEYLQANFFFMLGSGFLQCIQYSAANFRYKTNNSQNKP